MNRLDKQDILKMLLKSECVTNSIYSVDDILQWIIERNNELVVNIKKIPLSECSGWRYDESEGVIRNESGTFFSISGLVQQNNDVSIEQPILLQQAIGYLGILCSKINGVLHFLMQAKIEPGNINCIQLSPTIQATKSNFTRKHGEKEPAYLKWFVSADASNVIVDQIQSEQSSRFLGKRNRNTIIYVEDYTTIEILPSHRWMTLGQIRKLMRVDNIVNMDSRTVISCIPYSTLSQTSPNPHCPLFNSVFKESSYSDFRKLTRKLNDYKMFDDSTVKTVPLLSLSNWEFKDNAFTCKAEYPFKVIFCDIEIEGREVRHWHQPLFEAIGKATFALVYCDDFGDNVRRFLCKVTPEIGAFDKIELGPTIQIEAGTDAAKHDAVTERFFTLLENKNNIEFDHFLSEEGGRFYHEQNRNLLIKASIKDFPSLPSDYFWLDYTTINNLIQINNQANIQLRNLLSLIEVKSDKI